MKIWALVGLSIFWLLFSNSCQESIDVVGAFRPQLVVYCVLSAETDTQFVRVLGNYHPADGSTTEPPTNDGITGAQVTISDGNALYSFHDTVLVRPGGDSVHTYVVYGFTPAGNTVYNLSVHAQGYDLVSAQTYVPAHTVMDVDYTANAVIRYAWYSWNSNNSFYQPTVSFHASTGAAAYLVQLSMEFEDYRPEGVVLKDIAVPQWIELVACYAALYVLHYPEITPITSPGSNVTYRFRNWAWRHVADSVLDQGSYDPHFRRGVFKIIQFNGDWYKYYRTTRLFQDRFSIRLDEPDYTDIGNGWGIFGAFVVDTISAAMYEKQVPPDPRLGYSPCLPDN